MKFSCSRDTLNNVLTMLADVSPPRSAKPVLKNVQLKGNEDGSVTFSATDLEIGIRCRLEVEGLQDPGTVLLPVAKLAGLVRDEWAESLRFDIDGSHAEITAANKSFRLLGQTDEDFPPIKEMTGENFVQLKGEDITDAVRKTVFATAKADTRYALNGILVRIGKSGVEFVASDTHRLSLTKKKAKIRGQAGGEGIVLTKGMTVLARLAEDQELVKLQLTDRELIAETANATLVSRLVDGQFPRYQDVIPKKLDTKITVDKELLLRTLHQGGHLTDEETRCIKLSTAGGKLLLAITGGEAGDGQWEMEAEIEGGEISDISFNYIYILDLLRVLPGDRVTLQMQDRDNPARVDAGDFTHIIMPIKGRQ